jgi:hypothetical protein
MNDVVSASLVIVDGRVGNGHYGLVGHGPVSNSSSCGHYRLKVCLDRNLHSRRARLTGEDCGDKAYVKPVFFSCGKPSCPVCYESWCIVEARSIERRLAEASNLCGLRVEHLSVSAPLERYGLPEVFDGKKARREVERALRVRGVVGGCTAVHMFRRRKHGVFKNRYVWHVHYHVLGFIQGDCGHDGYDRCRSCRFNAPMGRRHCWDCEGFEGVTRRANLKDGMVVKVLDQKHERKTVWGTAKYELGHASLDYSKKRFQVVTWFGNCSYRKLKVEREKVKPDLCPLCGHELVWGRYVGNKLFDRASPAFRRGFQVDMSENGRPAFVLVESNRPEWLIGSGS